MRRRALLLGVLAAAALLLAFGFLAQRSLRAVRLEAEDSLRRRLHSEATEAAAHAEQRLRGRVLAAIDDGTAWRRRPDHQFRVPAEPVPFEPIELPADAPTDVVLLIEDAERAENRDGEEESAAGLYRLVAAESEDPAIRRLAIFRLAALEGRRGRRAEAIDAFTELLPLAGDTELALTAAAEGTPVPEAELLASLLPHVGLKGDSVAEGYARLLGLTNHPELLARRAELVRMDAIRSALPASPSREQVHFLDLPGDRDALVVGDAVLVLTPREFKALLPPGARSPGQAPDRGSTPGSPDEVSIAVKGPAGFDFVARAGRFEVDDAVRRQGLLLGTATVVAVVGGLIAIFTLLRGVARRAELARLKSEFVANVSHELRTPLSVIRLYAETLRHGRVPPGEEQEYAAVIDREAAALTGLVDRVLAFSGIDRGTRIYRLEPGDLKEFLRRMADECRDHHPEFDLTLDLAAGPPGEPCIATFDPHALAIAVGNLIDNAAKHGGGTATLRLTPVGTQGAGAGPVPGMYRIEVEDQGPGVPEEERARLFDRFMRGRRARESGVRGSGLGLALVRHAAEGHGGRAGYRAGASGGSVFHVTVPRTAPEKTEAS